MLLSQIHQLIMIDIPSSHHDHIFGKIHPLMVLNDHVSVDLMYVVDLAKDRETHHVLPIDVIVHILH